jgi:hypothetical protein
MREAFDGYCLPDMGLAGTLNAGLFSLLFFPGRPELTRKTQTFTLRTFSGQNVLSRLHNVVQAGKKYASVRVCVCLRLIE